MDKLDFYLDMLYSVQTALFRIRSEHSITALIAFTYGDLKDLEELLENAIAKKEVIYMVRKEATNIIRNHMRKLTKNIKDITFSNKTGDRLFVTLQDLFELRAICILAYNNLTGVDLQEEPFEKGGD